MTADHVPASMSGPGAEVDLLLTNATILTMDATRRILTDGAIAVRGPSIVEVDKTRALVSRYRTGRMIDVGGSVVQPGFVDGHVHLSHHLGRGTIPDHWPEHREHEQWLPYWLSMSPEDAYLSALLACLEMARNGTTTFCDMSGRHDAGQRVRAAHEVGLRGAVSEVCWDIPPSDSVAIGGTKACIRRLEDLTARYPFRPDALVWGGIALSGMGKASDELLVAAKEIARSSGLTMSMHQSFGPEDVQAYRESTGREAVQHLGELGILGPDLALVHMIHVTDPEVVQLAATGTNVVHCPGASTRTGMGASRYGRFPEMQAAGVNIGLGSDSGNYSDFFDIGRQAYLAATIHREARGAMPTISGEEALEMATINGARALGLEALVGSIEPGKRADIVVHGGMRPEWHPGLDVVNALLYSAQSGGVSMVIVDGRIIVEEGRSTLVDEAEAYERIDRAARDLFGRMGWRHFSRWPVE